MIFAAQSHTVGRGKGVAGQPEMLSADIASAAGLGCFIVIGFQYLTRHGLNGPPPMPYCYTRMAARGATSVTRDGMTPGIIGSDEVHPTPAGLACMLQPWRPVVAPDGTVARAAAR